MTSLIERARETVTRYGMFADGGGVVAGLSGGADSCALLHFLRFGLSLDVTACHLNHRLRGEEGERDERFCRSLCERWGVPLFVRSEAVANRPGSVEEAGREARYRFFAEVCAEIGALWIATAHTRSDNLETLLLNLARGTGPKGLCGIPPVRMPEVPGDCDAGVHDSEGINPDARLVPGLRPMRMSDVPGDCGAGVHGSDEINPDARLVPGLRPMRMPEVPGDCGAGGHDSEETNPGARLVPGLRPVVRPLIDCTREQVEAYCREQGIAYVTDSTNFDDSYTRNKIRLIVVPALRELYPAVEEAAARAAMILRDEDEILAAQAAAALAAAERADGWDAAALAALPVALGRRAVVLLLRRVGVNPDFALTERAREMLSAPFARWELAPGRFFAVRAGRASVRRELPPVLPYEFALEPGEERDLGFGVLRSEIRRQTEAGFPEKVQRNLLYLALDYDRIENKPTVRSKRPGDRAAFAGRGGTKTLKKVFQEAKLSAFEKSSRPVLADGAGIVGVPGFGPDVRCALSPGTRRALLVSWEPREEPR